MTTKIFLIFALLLFSGCAFRYYRVMNIGVQGKEIKTPYGNGDGQVSYNSTLEIGFPAGILNAEVK